MKRFFSLFMVCFIILMSGCQEKQDNSLAVWIEKAESDGNETVEELYKKALEEEILTIYSSSTRMSDVIKSFEKQYPGLTVKMYDVRTNEIIEMLKKTVDDGVYECDILLCSAGGLLEKELLPNGYIYPYIPSFLEGKRIDDNAKIPALMYEAVMFAYNNSVYSKSPISNWWELTEEKWRGKVLMPNPIRSETTFAFINMMVKNEAVLADSYKERYGKELEALPGEGAGKTFFRMLVQNGLTLTNSSDEVAEGVGAPGIKYPMVGIMVSSKIRLCDVGYAIAVDNDIAPFAGVASQNKIMLAGGAKNINAAKLFIRWIYGETDGQGVGYKPYIQKGSWPSRTDVRGDSELPLKEMNLVFLDDEYILNNKDELMVFWVSLVESKQ